MDYYPFYQALVIDWDKVGLPGGARPLNRPNWVYLYYISSIM